MINLTASQIINTNEAQFISAQTDLKATDFIISNVSTSSREIGDNTLFIPLKGERFDAHDFISDAIKNGAKIFATAKSIDELVAAGQDRDLLLSVPHLLCKDTLRLLGLIGQLVRHNVGSLVVGAITGSCGKTTTKELCAAILKEKGRTLFTQGNFNNDVGVPLTLLRLTSEDEFAIIEQGASHLQDIARTCEFVDADYALITNIGAAHIEGFGSLKGVYHGKSEILDSLFARHDASSKSNIGIGVIPADSPFFNDFKTDRKAFYDAGKLVSFGLNQEATMRVSNVREAIDENTGFPTLKFKLTCTDPRFLLDSDITLNTLGEHNAINAAGAALLAMAMGASAAEVVRGLASYKNVSGRLSFEKNDKLGLTIIDDAYNASHTAVLAAIDTLSRFDSAKERIFIFGDMGELGQDAAQLHNEVGTYAKGKVDAFFALGNYAKGTIEHMGPGGRHFSSHDELNSFLKELILKNHEKNKETVCLVKGSHAMHMDDIVKFLKAL